MGGVNRFFFFLGGGGGGSVASHPVVVLYAKSLSHTLRAKKEVMSSATVPSFPLPQHFLPGFTQQEKRKCSGLILDSLPYWGGA